MFKKLSLFLRDFSFYELFLPLRRNGFYFTAFAALGFLFLRREFYQPDSQFNPYLELFAWLTGTFALMVIGIGLLYTLVCWVYLITNRNKIIADISIGLEDGQKGEIGKVPVKLSLSRTLMPLIGYLKMWVVFDDGSTAGPVILNTYSKGWKDLLPKEGDANLWLTERKQYNIKGFVIGCEDYLQFFRFSLYKKAKRSFYLYPPEVDVPTQEITPSKSEEMVERIKTSRKVEGDYLSYKDFESGDDVRRIVWKIFAKNRELVVRIPEIINPYASHIHFFGSFYNSLSSDPLSEYAVGMLNYYKDMIYNVCLSLEKSERKVQFNIDQPVNESITVEAKDDMAYKLSCAEWQTELPATDLQVPASEAIICVSSLIPVDELEELINRRPVSLFVIKTSKYLDTQNLFNWKNMFLRNERTNELSKLSWMLSSSRRRLKDNEKKISELVESNNFQGQVI